MIFTIGYTNVPGDRAVVEANNPEHASRILEAELREREILNDVKPVAEWIVEEADRPLLIVMFRD